MKKQRKITFNIGDENRIVIEKITKENIGNSIFSDPYRFALESLNSYFESMPQKKEDRLKENELWRNNIFAFIGDRGSGKTSCMESVAQLLVEPSDLYKNNRALQEKYYKVDMVDPSFIDNESNVIGVILASLYKKFQDYSHKEKVREALRVELAGRFANVQHDFCRMMEANHMQEDDLEALSSLSAAIDLKKSMLELIDSFMKFIGKENAILLIPIDDIDLHTKAANEMVEQIRKYLVLPNVLILMAVKISQLSKLKRLQFSREYKDERNTLKNQELDEMVDRYMTKLVPYSHRIYMPDAGFYWDADLTIKKNGMELYHNVSTRQAIPELIFKKTRYLFYNSSVKTSYIVPDNLRELRQLTRLLIDMNDYRHYDDVVKDTVEEPNNKDVFKKYLFESWMMSHLDEDSQLYVRELLEITDAVQMNAFTLRIIRQKFYEKDETGKIAAPWTQTEKIDGKNIKAGEIQELDYIMGKDNMVYNVAIGDVMAVINHLERLDITTEQMLFLFIVKTIYSIRLYEFYDEYTDLIDMQEDAYEQSVNHEVVLKRVLYENLQIPNYFKLVGGRFFNSRASLSSFPQKNKQPSRTNRVINLSVLKDLMDKCIHHSADVTTEHVMLAEFFMLCTSRLYKSRHSNNVVDYYEPTFRTNKELVYGVSLKDKNNAIFDLASFLYNIIDYERCCSRFSFGKEFIGMVNAKDEPTFADSLFHRFHLLTESSVRNEMEEEFNLRYKPKSSVIENVKKDKDYTKHEWLSWACVRNVEILDDLISYLDEDEYKAGGSDINRLKDFFNRLASYSIHSYDLKENENEKDLDYYCINYRFAALIAELLAKIDTDESLKKLFKSIYGDDSVSENKANDNFDPLSIKLDEDIVKAMIPLNKSRRTSTLNKMIKEKYSKFASSPYEEILDAELSPNGRSQKNKSMVHSIVNKINAEVDKISLSNGNAETNNQDAVPTTEE